MSVGKVVAWQWLNTAQFRAKVPAGSDSREWNALVLQSDLDAAIARAEALERALVIAEAALADIGDADREPGDDLAWCERRAAQALPKVRAAIAAQQAEGVISTDSTGSPPPVNLP